MRANCGTFGSWIWHLTRWAMNPSWRMIHGAITTAPDEAMTSFKLSHIHQFRDRHGKIRRYTRRKGFPRVALPGRPGSPEFMMVYNSAMENATLLPPSRYGDGTI